MRLLHIGIFDEKEPQFSLREALRNNSSFYLEYDFRNLSMQQIAHIMLDSVNRDGVNVMFLQIQTANILPIDVLSQLHQRGVKIFNFCGDVRTPFPQWFLDVAPYCYTLFTNEHDTSIIQSHGFKAEHFQVGYNENFYNSNGDVLSEADIVFLGNNYVNVYPLSNFRFDITNFLYKTYREKFKVYGSGWWSIPSRDLNYKQTEEAAVYRGAKLAINISHFDYGRYSSDRLFRIMACGCMCLSHKYHNIDKDFIDGVHLRTWSNENELKELIDYYLVHEHERKQIALNGQRHVQEYFTWNYRISNQLKKIIYELDK
jgi:hypothetical protein